MSTLSVDTIQGKSTAGTVAMPSGHVVQVLSTTKTDDFSTTSTSYTDITGLSVAITPKFSSSKILVSYVVNGSNYGSGMTLQLLRDSTIIGSGTGTGTAAGATGLSYPGNFSATTETHANQFLDSPSTTSATTYKIQTRRNTSSGTTYVNRDSDGTAKASSTITVMEILA